MPQQDSDTAELKESEEVLGMSFPSNHESSKIVQPSEQPFDLPAMPIASKGSTILRLFLSISPVRRDHLDASFEQ